jgi:hypothetical protein
MRIRQIRRLLLAIPILFAPLGCTVWRRDDAALLVPVPERKPVQIFTSNGTILAHSIWADSTTLSYIPRLVPSECDSCRRTIPRASVDSIRTSAISPARTLILITGLIVLVVWARASTGA